MQALFALAEKSMDIVLPGVVAVTVLHGTGRRLPPISSSTGSGNCGSWWGIDSTLNLGVSLTRPLIKGPRVAQRPVVAEDLQDNRRETRPRTPPSIGHDRGLRCDPLGAQERVELVCRL